MYLPSLPAARRMFLGGADKKGGVDLSAFHATQGRRTISPYSIHYTPDNRRRFEPTLESVLFQYDSIASLTRPFVQWFAHPAAA